MSAFFAILNFLQSVNGIWRLFFLSLFWASVGIVSLYFSGFWDFWGFGWALIMVIYHLSLWFTVLTIMPIFYSMNSGRRFKHIKKLLKCFLEMSVMWYATLVKLEISKVDMKEGQIALFILAISIYFIVVIFAELILLANDLGLINAAASVIVLLLSLAMGGSLGFRTVPISTIVVFLKTIMMAECCEECRERKQRKKIKRQPVEEV